MYSGLISANIPNSVKADVLQKLEEIDNLLSPYYISLSNDQKAKIPKVGDELQAFVEDCMEEVNDNDEFLPKYADTGELDSDAKLFDTADDIFRPLENITDNVESIRTASGSDALVVCLAYYHNVQRAAKLGIPNAQAIYDRLKVHFSNRGANGGTAPGTP